MCVGGGRGGRGVCFVVTLWEFRVHTRESSFVGECEHHPGCQQSGSFLLGPGHLSPLCLIVCEMRSTALNMGSLLKLHINVLEGSRYCTHQNNKSKTVRGGFFETAIEAGKDVAGSGMESWQSCGEVGR